MRSLLTTILSLAAAALLATPILAQRPGTGGAPESATLLANKGVQDELKLSEDQKATIRKILDKRSEDLKKAREDMDREKFQAAFKEFGNSIKKVKDELKPAQSKRLNQIFLQASGVRAFTVKEVQTGLALTEKQKKEANSIVKAYQKEIQELFKDAGRDREKFAEARKKAEELARNANDKSLGLLTAEQKTKWKEMTRPKFEFKPDQPAGRGGRTEKKKDA